MKHILEFNAKAFLIGAPCFNKCCEMRHGSDTTNKLKTEYLCLVTKYIFISLSFSQLINLNKANMCIQI